MNNKYKILLVEDEPSIRKYVNALLNASGYIVIEAANCAEAKPCFLSHTPDLVLLDLGLPDGDGMQLLEFIRSRSAVPVIVLSARSDETDKVLRLTAVQMIMLQSLSVGRTACANAFRSPHRATARNQAKRTAGSASAHSRSIAMPAAFLQAESEVRLTQTEYNLLLLLAENSGRMMTYQKVIKAVWGEGVNEANIKKLQVNIANIEKNLPGVCRSSSRHSQQNSRRLQA